MSNYSESDFCSVEDGLDYTFAVLGAIYGAGLSRHFEGMDLGIVRKVWADQVGRFLTYKPSIDYAIKRCSPDFPPRLLGWGELAGVLLAEFGGERGVAGGFELPEQVLDSCRVGGNQILVGTDQAGDEFGGDLR